MPIEMPKGLPFSVDTFSSSSKRKRHHFLTHAHKDHTSGISTHFSYPIYSTHLTKSLVLQHFPQIDDSLFVSIEVGESVVIDDPYGESKSQLLMLIIALVINCIWKHPNAAKVYLTCGILGQEEILVNVSRTFGSKIYVDKATSADCFQYLKIIVPEILSEDPSSRFQVFDGFPNLSERAATKLADAQANFQPEPLIIRPSAMWYACEEECSEMGSRSKIRFNEAIKDQFGVWHVCYSMHSSREELEWALKLLAPKRVVSTTISCRAMELDYVRKHCFHTKLSSDDPLWKLLDIDVEACPQVNSPVKSVACLPMVDEPTQTVAESDMQPMNAASCKRKLLSLSPPSKKPPVTLFGQARQSLHTSNFDITKQVSVIQELTNNESNNREYKLEGEDATLQNKKLMGMENCEKILESKLDTNVAAMVDEGMRRKTYYENRCENRQVDETTVQHKTLTMKETQNNCSYFSVGSSKSYSDSFRKLYRSMHVPVPKPLPSLLELMKAKKQFRRV